MAIMPSVRKFLSFMVLKLIRVGLRAPVRVLFGSGGHGRLGDPGGQRSESRFAIGSQIVILQVIEITLRNGLRELGRGLRFEDSGWRSVLQA